MMVNNTNLVNVYFGMYIGKEGCEYMCVCYLCHLLCALGTSDAMQKQTKKKKTWKKPWIHTKNEIKENDPIWKWWIHSLDTCLFHIYSIPSLFCFFFFLFRFRFHSVSFVCGVKCVEINATHSKNTQTHLQSRNCIW